MVFENFCFSSTNQKQMKQKKSDTEKSFAFFSFRHLIWLSIEINIFLINQEPFYQPINARH